MQTKKVPWGQWLELNPLERGIVVKNGVAHRILGAGRHWLARHKSIEVLIQGVMGHADIPNADVLARRPEEWLVSFVHVVALAVGEVGLVTFDGRVREVVPDGQSRLYWKNGEEFMLHRWEAGAGRLPLEVAALFSSTSMLPPGIQRFNVGQRQRGMVLHRGNFLEFLDTGDHYFYDAHKELAFVQFDLDQPLFNHAIGEYLAATEPELVQRELELVRSSDSEVAVVHAGSNIFRIVGPSQAALFWKKGHMPVRVERLRLTDIWKLDHSLADEVCTLARNGKLQLSNEVKIVEVPEHHASMLYIDGDFKQKLEPGTHVYWQFNRRISATTVDLRAQSLEVNGQEILTKDKINLRINLGANFRVTDLAKWVASHEKPMDFLYKEIQLGIRAGVGLRTLDELLENKSVLDAVVREHMETACSYCGIELVSVGTKDIILPGEMRELLSKVVEAEKSAQANVIRRREETAATRSMLNTAKLMEGSPMALRLKELETLEKVTEKIDRISVFGGLDGILDGLVKINPKTALTS
jgi:regulator of protease activity HflC (stomatin/prohibitin superfamily)